MRIGVDIDNVILNTSPLLEKRVQEQFGPEWNVWNIYRKYRLADSMCLSFWDEVKFWRKYGLEIAVDSGPLPFCRKSLKWLKQQGIKIYLITARPSIMKPATIAWLKKHRIPYDDIFFGSTNKGKLCKELGVHVMVEDSDKNIKNLLEHGIFTVAMPYPYNANLRHRNLVHLGDWRYIAQFIWQLKQIRAASAFALA